MAIKAIINNTEKEIEQIKNSDEQDIDYVYSRIGDTEVEGEPPISIKSIGGNLTNYRIYGQTVDVESVGDRTGNLFDEKYEDANIHYVPIKVEDGEYTLSTTIPNAGAPGGSPAANVFLLAGNVNTGVSTVGNGCWLDNPKTVQSIDGYVTIAYKATESFGERCYPWNNKTMLNSGSTALPYEPYGYRVPVTTGRSVPHTATLQLHDCLPSTMQLDAPEALYYAENGLPAGTYNFTIQDNYDTSYGGGKTYQFTLANDVPAKGQLVFGWDYHTQASAAKITSYASSTSTAAIENVRVTEGSGGTSLGTTDGNSTNVNHIHRVRYGSSNYKESAIRQFLNSSAVAGSVWTPQTKYDRPPSWNSNTAGFMKDIDSDFLAVLGASPKVVALNTVTDGGGSVTINNDKFFLLSRSEVYGGKENNINEGEPYPYYSNYSDLSAAGTGDDSNRIKYRSGTAQIWWLRSPYSAYSSNARFVYAGGNVSHTFVSVNNGVAPACNIALDEDYKFNGQVLHVRDQISVTKGNQTLVFDVIGIDHDEVHFDKRTVDIYLPEPLKMVGDEAEYIEYGEQKQHRVRKNLWSGVVEQGNVSQYGVYGSDNKRIRSKNVPIEPGTYMISSNVLMRIIYAYNDDQKIGICLNSADGVYSRSFTVPAGANNIAISMMKRVAGVQVDITPSDFIWGQIEKGSEATTYEPYIENTDLNVTLPALPTLSGTNTLSVGTEVQPSRVYLKGKIKEIN